MMRKITAIPLFLLFVSLSFAGTYSGGSGTSSSPYLISTAADVNELSITSGDWVSGKYFKMTNDINLPTDVNYITPIGNSNIMFQGTFDGNHYAIRNLNQCGVMHMGLFGKSNSAIINLGIEDANIVSSSSYGLSYSGILTGKNYSGYIANCYSTGKISGAGDKFWYVGGLVGESSGSIIESYSTADVTGSGNTRLWYVGGLVGASNPIIIKSYSTGSVTVSGNSTVMYVGGLVGIVGVMMEESYSTASVSADGNDIRYIGGLSGYNHLVNEKNCYSTGNVSVNGSTVSSVGGLTGCDLSSYTENCYSVSEVTVAGTVSKIGSFIGSEESAISYMVGYSFWNTDINPALPGLGYVIDSTPRTGFVGRTTSQMKQQTSFTGWDFVNVWDIGEGQTYPFLRKYNISDLNRDGIVNMLDFAIFANNWLLGT
jgi:hypothetical protein